MLAPGFPLAPESPPPLLCTLPPLWPNQQLQVRLVPSYEYKPLNASGGKSRLMILWVPGPTCRGNMLKSQGAPDFCPLAVVVMINHSSFLICAVLGYHF